MEQVVSERLTLIDAIGPLGVSYRHAKRLKSRYASSRVRFLPFGALNKIGENIDSTRWPRIPLVSSPRQTERRDHRIPIKRD